MRKNKTEISKETLNILRFGKYTIREQVVDIGDQLWLSKRGTILYKPEDERFEKMVETDAFPTEFTVARETTLEGIAALNRAGKTQIGALNFASAKNPGGGFMGEAQAQEESLARCSSLYANLLECQEMYDFNKRDKSSLYSDYMSYAPGVVVFRNDALELLEEPMLADFVTAPAVNRNLTDRDRKVSENQIDACMLTRMEKVLKVFYLNGCRNLVLGAWGCGVFKNDPEKVAGYFEKLLTNQGVFANVFESVRFSVLDSKGKTFAAFEKTFVNVLVND